MNRDWYDNASDKLIRFYKAYDLVQKQAADEGLWSLPSDSHAALCQEELRKLHAIIEGKPTADVSEEL